MSVQVQIVLGLLSVSLRLLFTEAVLNCEIIKDGSPSSYNLSPETIAATRRNSSASAPYQVMSRALSGKIFVTPKNILCGPGVLVRVSS